MWTDDNRVFDDGLVARLGLPLFWVAIALYAPVVTVADPGDLPEAEGSLGDALGGKAPEEPELGESQEEAEQSVGRYAYWDDGWHLTGPKAAVELLWNAKIDGDIGNTDADRALLEGFPDLEGDHSEFRRANLALLGEWKDKLQFKIEVDFADTRSIKDDWLRFLGNSFISHFTFGHMKEPYSLDQLTSSTYSTYMESALPTSALGPSRNVGILVADTAQNERLTWAGGVFLNTGSFSDQGEARDQIANASGYNLTGRLTGLPQFGEEGRKLTHLGVSYSYRVRAQDREDSQERYSTRPESRLSDDRLVDTGEFPTKAQNLINLEAAWKNGPLLLQGEFFWNSAQSSENLDFYGGYLSGSYVVTGESRAYRRSGGVFGSITPARPFSPGQGQWGAMELATRLSVVDLNDKSIRGGGERNITLGLNWYLQRKIRLMFNYVHVNVQDRPDPPIQDSNANIVMARLQTHF